MLKRQQSSLFWGLARIHGSLGGDKAPGAFLNSLHALAAKASQRVRQHGERWLAKVDESLRDLRGFTPEVAIQFADFPPIQYSRDWATAFLDRPCVEDLDGQEVWRYPGDRSQSLRARPRRIELQLLCPDGRVFPGVLEHRPDALAELKRQYLAFCRREERRYLPADRDFLAQAHAFIDVIGILVRKPAAAEEPVI
jgi:hypothetical protein